MSTSGRPSPSDRLVFASFGAPGCRPEGWCYISGESRSEAPAASEQNALAIDSLPPSGSAMVVAPFLPSHSARGDRPDMLDAFIIDRIRRERESREREERRQQRPQLDMPRPPDRPSIYERPEEDEAERAPERGVVIIDFTI